jgi:hypothetical protein
METQKKTFLYPGRKLVVRNRPLLFGKTFFSSGRAKGLKTCKFKLDMAGKTALQMI